MNQPSSEFIENLYNKSYEEASDICRENKFELRIMKKDDVDYFGTCDLRFDRINIHIKNGIITNCYTG